MIIPEILSGKKITITAQAKIYVGKMHRLLHMTAYAVSREVKKIRKTNQEIARLLLLLLSKRFFNWEKNIGKSGSKPSYRFIVIL